MEEYKLDNSAAAEQFVHSLGELLSSCMNSSTMRIDLSARAYQEIEPLINPAYGGPTTIQKELIFYALFKGKLILSIDGIEIKVARLEPKLG